MVKLAWPFSSECVECRRYKSLSFITDLLQNKLERLSLENIFFVRSNNCVEVGRAKANGREPNSCLGLVFNFKFGRYVMYAIALHI